MIWDRVPRVHGFWHLHKQEWNGVETTTCIGHGMKSTKDGIAVHVYSYKAIDVIMGKTVAECLGYLEQRECSRRDAGFGNFGANRGFGYYQPKLYLWFRPLSYEMLWSFSDVP